MNNIVKVISSKLDSAGRLLVKALRLGKDDVQEVYSASSFGFDSSPIKDMSAIYSATLDKGSPVIIGYINKDLKCSPGESRIFSTDENGGLKFEVYCKNDGTLELGGNSGNLVRFQELKTGLNSGSTDINTELNKIAIAINAIVPGSYSPIPININIDSSKIEEIKTL